jgi:hypothetical protein
MAEKRLLWQRATRALVGAGGAAVFIALSCGEAPLEPRECGWVKLGEFPSYSINAVCERDGILRAVGENDTGGVILVRRGATFSTEYVSPSNYEDAQLTDIVSGLRGGWAAGSRKINGIDRPFLLRYAGRWPSGKWEEVDTSAFPSGIITAVYRISDDDCWLLIDKKPGRGKPSAVANKNFGVLAKYSAGEFKEYDDFGLVSATEDPIYYTPSPGRRKNTALYTTPSKFL